MKQVDMLMELLFKPLVKLIPKDFSLKEWLAYLFDIKHVSINMYLVKIPFRPPGKEHITPAWQNQVRGRRQAKTIFSVYTSRKPFKEGDILCIREDAKRDLYEIECTAQLQYGVYRPIYHLNKEEFDGIKSCLISAKERSSTYVESA